MDEATKRFCNASRKSDVKRIITLLSLRNIASLSFDEELLTSTDSVSLWLENLLIRPHEHVPYELLIKGVFMVPSAYELPWKFMSSIVQFLVVHHNNLGTTTNSLVWAVREEVQSFLRSAVAYCREEDRRRPSSKSKKRNRRSLSPGEKYSKRAPRYWIQQLVESIAAPLQASGYFESYIEHWEHLLGAIPFVLCICRDVDSVLLRTCLDAAIRSNLKRIWLPHWVDFLGASSSLLQEHDWVYAHDLIASELSPPVIVWKNIDLIRLAKGVFALALEQMSSSVGTNSRTCQWQALLLVVLANGTRDQASYSAIEKSLLQEMSLLSFDALSLWTKYLCDGSSAWLGIGWLKVNLILLTMQAYSGSGLHLVSKLITCAPADFTNEVKELDRECRKAILELALRLETSNASKTSKQGSTLDGDPIGTEDSQCSDNGNVVKGMEKDPCKSLSSMGKIVYKSLFFHSPWPFYSKDAPIGVVDRAQAWVSYADTYLVSMNSIQPLESSFCVAILSVVFQEAPQTRCVIVELVCDALQYARTSEKLESLVEIHSMLVFNILNSVRKEDYQELRRLVDCLWLPMQEASFRKLATVFATDKFCRELMWKVANELLCDDKLGFLTIVAGKSTGRKDEMRRGLLLLMVLIKTDPWGILEYKSWFKLSEALIYGLPRMSPDLWTWLVSELQRMVEDQQFSLIQLEHLIRASLTGSLMCISCGLNAASFTGLILHTSQFISGLLELAISASSFLVEKQTDDQNRTLATGRQWYERLLLLTTDGVNQSVAKGEVSLLSDITFRCVFLAVQTFQEQYIETEFFSAAKAMIGTMRKHEKDAFMEWDSRFSQPLWVTKSGLEDAMDGPLHASRVDLVSCFDYQVLLSTRGFLVGPRWHSLLFPPRVPVGNGIQSGPLSFLLYILRRVSDNSMSNSTPAASFSIVCAFHDIALPSWRKALAAQTRSHEVDTILNAITLANRFFTHATQATATVVRTMNHLWDVYTSLYQHKAIQEIILYLRLPTLAEDVPNPDSMDEIDVFIRGARSAFLRSCTECFGSNLLLNPQVRNEALSILVAFIKSFGEDMQQDVDGKSGGLTYEIYELYLDCTEAALKVILDSVSTPSEKGESHANALNDLAAVVVSVVNEHSLDTSSLCKRSIALACYSLPMVANELIKVKILAGDTGALAFYSVHNIHLTNMLKRCTNLLSTRSSNPLAPWDDVSEKLERDCMSEGVPPVNRIIRTAGEKSNIQRAEPRSSRSSIGFRSEKHWIWVFGAVLDAFSLLWCAKDSETMNHSCSLEQSARNRVDWFKLREQELFLSTSILKDSIFSGKERPANVLRLPDIVKHRLFSALDQLLTARVQSVRCIIKATREEKKKDIDTLAYLESLACLAAWLRPREKRLDLSSIVLAWLCWEQVEATDASSSNISAVPGRLSKLYGRCEELDSELGRLAKCKEDKRIEGKDFSTFVSRIEHFDQVVGLNLVDVIKEARTLFRNERDRIQKESGISLSLKRKAPKGGAKQRRRKDRHGSSLKSGNPRNQTIDQWLKLDREIARGGESFDEDGYADLEDFLVEG